MTHSSISGPGEMRAWDWEELQSQFKQIEQRVQLDLNRYATTIAAGNDGYRDAHDQAAAKEAIAFQLKTSIALYSRDAPFAHLVERRAWAEEGAGVKNPYDAKVYRKAAIAFIDRLVARIESTPDMPDIRDL